MNVCTSVCVWVFVCFWDFIEQIETFISTFKHLDSSNMKHLNANNLRNCFWLNVFGWNIFRLRIKKNVRVTKATDLYAIAIAFCPIQTVQRFSMCQMPFKLTNFKLNVWNRFELIIIKWINWCRQYMTFAFSKLSWKRFRLLTENDCQQNHSHSSMYVCVCKGMALMHPLSSSE